MKRTLIYAALTGMILAMLVGLASAQTPDPRTYPLATLNPTLGPVYTYNWDDGAGNDVSYGGTGMGISEDGQLLYISCNSVNARRGIATFRIPTQGTQLQLVKGCSGPDVTEIKKIHPDPNAGTPQIGGILQYGGKIVVSGVITYDAGGTTAKSHWMGPDLDHLSGPFNGTVAPGYVKGGMGIIPQEWRALLGGPAFALSGYDSISSRQSYTPSFTVFDPSTVVADNFPMQGLVICKHNDPGCNTYQSWGPATTQYEGSELEGGAFILAGTRTLIHIEREGLGTPEYVNGVPTGPNMCAYGYTTNDHNLHGKPYPSPENTRWSYSLSDPLNEKGPKCYPYLLVAKQTDLLDVLAVKNGTKQPYQVRPYTQTILPSGLPDPTKQQLQAGAFDPIKNRLYMIYSAGGGVNNVHTLDFGPPQPPPPSTDCVPGIEQRVSDDSLTAQCVNGFKHVAELWTRVGDIPATGNGQACTPIVSPRFRDDPCSVLPTGALTNVPATCTVTMTLTATSGSVQFQRRLVGATNWSSHGTKTTTMPFTRAATVAAGEYEGQAVWSGNPTPIPLGRAVCR